MRNEQAEVLEVFNEQRDMLLKIANKYMKHLYEYTIIEETVDDVFVRTLTCTQIKKGFNDKLHVMKYLYKAVARTSKTKAREKILEIKYPPLKEEERQYWYQFTRDFFDEQARERKERLDKIGITYAM